MNERIYYLLSKLLDYPTDMVEIREAVKELFGMVNNSEVINDNDRDGIIEEMRRFLEFVNSSSLERVQEEYTRTFDLLPLIPPYISHHIYGESYKKGEYMVLLKEVYNSFNFKTEKKELPDHISIIMEFLSVLDGEDRIRFIDYVIDGLKRMNEVARRRKTPYSALIILSYKLCLKELEEVIGCSMR